jgi:hypothetical protein
MTAQSLFRRVAIFTSALAVIAVVSVPSAPAKSSKQVVTPCCELLVPSWLKYRTNGNGIVSVGGTMYLSVNSLSARSSVDATSQLIESLEVREVTYEKDSSQWSVRTGFLEDGSIFYIRAEFDRGCDEAGFLVVTYPSKKKKAYYNDVTAMSKSFRADLCG